MECSWQRRKQRRSRPRRRLRSQSRRKSSSRTMRRRRPGRLLTIPASSIFLIPAPHRTSRCPNEHFFDNASERLAPDRTHDYRREFPLTDQPSNGIESAKVLRCNRIHRGRAPHEMKNSENDDGTTGSLSSQQASSGRKKKGEVITTSPPPFP